MAQRKPPSILSRVPATQQVISAVAAASTGSICDGEARLRPASARSLSWRTALATSPAMERISGLPLGASLVRASIRADSWRSKPALLRHESGRAVLTFQVSQAHGASVERVIEDDYVRLGTGSFKIAYALQTYGCVLKLVPKTGPNVTQWVRPNGMDPLGELRKAESLLGNGALGDRMPHHGGIWLSGSLEEHMQGPVEDPAAVVAGVVVCARAGPTLEQTFQILLGQPRTVQSDAQHLRLWRESMTLIGHYFQHDYTPWDAKLDNFALAPAQLQDAALGTVVDKPVIVIDFDGFEYRDPQDPKTDGKTNYHILMIWMHSYLKVLDSADSSWRVPLVTSLHGALDDATALPAIAELRARHRRSGLFAFSLFDPRLLFLLFFFTARICIADMEKLYQALFAALSGA